MSLRARLTLVYAVLFLFAGSGLLALSYGLLADRLPKPASEITSKDAARLDALCKQKLRSPNPELNKECAKRLASAERSVTERQRAQTLSTMLDAALVGLGAATLLSGVLGWAIAGRIIRPMEAATASRRRFIANAAHELRTPLSAMRTALDVTLSKQPAPTLGQLSEAADSVSRSVDQAAAIIEALLTLSSAEAGQRASAEVDLAPAAEDALDAAAAEITSRGLTLEVQTEPAPTVGDRILIERLVGNLVDNAVRHNVDGGTIELRTSERDGVAELTISNSGPELDAGTLATLFEPFARAERTGDGVGLGLSIAEAIAQSHGAAISASPRAGGGLDVRVVFSGR